MTSNPEERWIETPEADRVEQLVPIVEDPDTEPDSSAPGEISPHEVDANEADLLEGAIPVPFEDDYPDGR